MKKIFQRVKLVRCPKSKTLATLRLVSCNGNWLEVCSCCKDSPWNPAFYQEHKLDSIVKVSPHGRISQRFLFPSGNVYRALVYVFGLQSNLRNWNRASIL